jgi:ubiquinone/menaquinone biosynthesis C-methylase UbiE
MADDGEGQSGYLPALRWKALTPLFDHVVRVTTRERTSKLKLIEQADIAAGASVLDLGCGTGTLAIWLKQRVAEAEVTGLDADPDVLSRARRKAFAASTPLEFVEASSTELPFADESFHAVLSTLFFHHLRDADKQETLSEVVRVLRPGGELHVADYGRPQDPLMAAAFIVVRAFDGFQPTAANARGELPELFRSVGLANAERRSQLRTPLGTLAFYAARKPS